MSKYECDWVGEQELTQDQYEEAGRAANGYSVSLVNGDHLIGSATLVSVGSAYGLLTAHHVWRDLLGKDKEQFCMVFGPHPGRFEYRFDKCTPVVMTNDEGSPQDLSFIGLNDAPKLETIKDHQSFYALEEAKGEWINKLPYDKPEMPWLLWGAPCEQSSVSSTERLLRINHFAGRGEFVGRSEHEGCDEVKIRVPAGSYRFPNKFNGCSGGGVWLPFRESEDPKAEVLKPMVSLLLAGVTCFQNDGTDYKTLTLHGPKSIYERVIQAVEGIGPKY